MTEPTNAEIEALFVEETGFAIDDFPAAILDFARAAIAKWGTPPAVGGEPECTCSAKDAPFGTCCKVRSAFERWYDEQNYGRLQPFDVFKGGWIERHRLSSTPQPTQAQAGAVPLTEAQREAIWQECRYDNGEGWEVDCWGVIDAVERMHNIKGGQHG